MQKNPLAKLAELGQSVWYDQMERALVLKGTLRKLIEDDDLRGLTSNPTIFEKALASSSDYDAQLRALAAKGASRDEIYEAIVIQDIGSAADVFRPVFDRTAGGDGFCSLEVSPDLADDTAKTTYDAKRLFETLGRPNVMIKIPATAAGIPAIEESIASGLNINVTLIFSQKVYGDVMEAYLRGLERRVAAGEPIHSIASVASFFVSRIDTLVDKEIEAKIAATSDAAEKQRLESLLGKVAVANAKVAYQMFKARFGSERFAKLRAHGARVQRPLWASTGTKNPKYSDVLYIDDLIGPDTVNTIPPKTFDAFRDHGVVRLTLEEGVEEARRVLQQLEDAGISLEAATHKLTVDGVKSFADSFALLLQTIETRRKQSEVAS
jgi:transaldolase, mycobacterial type